MGSCGDSADGWEETREGTRRRQGRRRGIICNVSTLGWAALAWWHLTSEAAHRTGTRQRGLGRVLACCCVSLCCVYCCALPRQQRAGGRWRQNTVAASHPWPPPDQAWSPHRQHQPPRPHQLPAAAAATPPAGGRHAPSWGQVGGAAAGWWCAVGAVLRSVRPVYWSGPAAGHHLLLYGYVQCSVQSPVCACLSSPTWDHGLVQSAVCSVSRAAEHQIIGWLIHFPSSNKLTNFALFPNLTTFYFYYVLRDPTWK